MVELTGNWLLVASLGLERWGGGGEQYAVSWVRIYIWLLRDCLLLQCVCHWQEEAVSEEPNIDPDIAVPQRSLLCLFVLLGLADS